MLHAGAFAAYAFWPARHTPVIDLDGATIKTRLVKLGKTRDEKMLPRLPSSPSPPSVDKKAPPTPDKDTKERPDPDASKKASAADILQQLKNDNPSDVNDIIKRRIGEQTDEGKEQGDRDGTDLEGEIKATYFARLTKYIKDRMAVSSVLSDEERIRLRAVLKLEIAEDGTIVSATIQTSSGSTVFDSDVVAAATKSSPVPAPPIPVRALSASGVALNFCPISCR